MEYEVSEARPLVENNLDGGAESSDGGCDACCSGSSGGCSCDSSTAMPMPTGK